MIFHTPWAARCSIFYTFAPSHTAVAENNKKAIFDVFPTLEAHDKYWKYWDGQH